MELKNLDTYLRFEWGYMHLLWSDNPPADPETATAVISINIYDREGGELDGGELDIQSTDFDLTLYVKDCMELMQVEGEYEEITEDDFYEVVHDYWEVFDERSA